jgi:hypothetical protein
MLLKELLDPEHGVFGKVNIYIYVIEFQKRGLPHAHILIIIDPADKPLTPEYVDTVISAEIPDPVAYPELHQVVVSSMLHGSYGPHNTSSPCMENGKCIKYYPKPFREHTTLPSDDYP